jgi:hypothetical protein
MTCVGVGIGAMGSEERHATAASLLGPSRADRPRRQTLFPVSAQLLWIFPKTWMVDLMESRSDPTLGVLGRRVDFETRAPLQAISSHSGTAQAMSLPRSRTPWNPMRWNSQGSCRLRFARAGCTVAGCCCRVTMPPSSIRRADKLPARLSSTPGFVQTPLRPGEGGCNGI